MPKLLLITASAPEIRQVRRTWVLNFQQITMPYLAARVPPGWEVIHIDEEVSPVDFDLKPDVVALTFHTPSALHAYETAARFRARGSCVAMGGPHVTLVPEGGRFPCRRHLHRRSRGLWEEFLTSFESGPHRRVYRPTCAAAGA